MHVEETFTVACSPEVVFDYVTDPANLSNWQTATTPVEPLTEGPPGLGSRYREHLKGPLGRGSEQVVEFSEFERPRRLRVRVVEAPYPIDGVWTFEPTGDATSVHFIAAGELRGPMKLLQPLAERALARQFAGYHRNLRRTSSAAEGNETFGRTIVLASEATPSRTVLSGVGLPKSSLFGESRRLRAQFSPGLMSPVS